MTRVVSRLARPLVAAVVVLLPISAFADDRYIVKFRDGAAGRAALSAAGAEVVLELGPQRAAAARIPAHALEAIARNPAIEYVELDPVRRPLAQTTPYGITMVEAKLAQSNYAVTGGNRKVCIIDSGFYVGHADLQTNGITGYPTGWNTDGCGHGTHVAGTIAALNNTDGVEGVLPNGVSLHIVKVFGSNCSWSYASSLVDAANRCQTAGANIISMSLGGTTKSVTEETAFNNLWSGGILSVAAAGNDGNTLMSYPASYSSVVSVAAIDSNKNIASFSQQNSQVDIAAPGVGVLSTVPWLEQNTLSDGTSTWSGTWIENAARSSGTSGTIVNGGLCTSSGAWGGAVVLCQRGSISFYDKVMNVQNGGGVAAVIYNNAAGGFSGTLGAGNTSQIPAIGISDADGAAALQSAGTTGTVVSLQTNPGSGYEAWDGTSMATPHVSGVAALVWSYNTSWTNQQIRSALEATAEDLGAAGRDNAYGYGLVRANAALAYLTSGSGGGGGTPTISLSATGRKVKGTRTVDLVWSGATTASVDVYRNGAVVTTTANDGAHTDSFGKGSGTFKYKVCEAASTVCSNEATVTF